MKTSKKVKKAKKTSSRFISKTGEDYPPAEKKKVQAHAELISAREKEIQASMRMKDKKQQKAGPDFGHRYTVEEQMATVRRILTSSESLAQIARDTGISAGSLAAWSKKYSPAILRESSGKATKAKPQAVPQKSQNTANASTKKVAVRPSAVSATKAAPATKADPVTKAAPVTKATTATKAAPDRKISRIDNENIPAAILADEALLKAWDAASDDEKYLGIALRNLNAAVATSDIQRYFDFAKQVDERFPRAQNKKFARGEAALTTAVKLADMSISRGKQIFSVIKLYTYDTYKKLADKAKENGVLITWTHLRVISWRLNKPDFAVTRKEVERRIVAKYHTEDQLNALIDELAPTTIVASEERAFKKPVKTRISSLLAEFQKNSKSFGPWLQAVRLFESDLNVDDAEAIRTARKQIENILKLFQDTSGFIQSVTEVLEPFLGTVTAFDNAENKKNAEELAKIAKRTAEKLSTEQKHAQKSRQQREDRVMANSAEFADDDSDSDRDDDSRAPLLDELVPKAPPKKAAVRSPVPVSDDEQEFPVRENSSRGDDEDFDYDTDDEEEDFEEEEEDDFEEEEGEGDFKEDATENFYGREDDEDGLADENDPVWDEQGNLQQ